MNARLIGVAIAAAALGLAGCERVSGGATTGREAVPSPSEQALARIPLGPPPGQGMAMAASVGNPFEGDAQAVAQGKALYSGMNCVYCHGAEGSGLIGPALNGPGWRYGGTPAQIYNSIHDGRPKGMPAWGGHLPAEQIWRLVAYIESLGGAQPPATRKMVALGGGQTSTTGPQVAGQDPADTAHQGLVSADQPPDGH